jgi:hypothetical protein
MRRILLAMTLAGAMVGGGMAVAQAPAPTADDHAAHHPAAKATPATPTAPAKPAPAPAAKGGATKGDPMMGGGGGMMNGMCPMMGGGGMGNGMGNGMMGGGMGPMMGGSATKVDVKKIDKGVTITMTSPDAATAARLQKMAEAMRLMHEASSQ